MALRVAVIGMRRIGNTHADVYHEHAETSLVAVCDMVKARADQAAQRLGVKAYYSVPSLLEAEALDAVSVATGGFENGGAHFKPTMQALEAGPSCVVRKAAVKRCRPCAGNGQQSEREKPLFRDESQSPLHAVSRASEGVGNGWKARGPTFYQYGVVD